MPRSDVKSERPDHRAMGNAGAQKDPKSNARAGAAIAYLNTRYPALSHTFIEREVRSARAAGVPIETFTIRPPTARDCMGDAHGRAAAETVCLFPSLTRLLWGQVRQVIRRPVGWLRAVVAGQKLSPPGVRARLNHLAYAMEAARLVEELDRRDLRHVHVHMANNGAAVALLACKMDPRLTYSLSIHGSAEFFHVKNWTLKEKVEGATFVRCISDFCKAQVMCWTSQTVWDRFQIVHCGIDPAAFTPKQNRGGDGGPLRIVTVGRLIAIKGYPVLLDACSRLSAQGLDWELTMIGDGEMRKDLERLAASMGLADRVKFPGPVSQEDMPAHLERADVMVISSFMEGIPVVLMEAMAKQLAVVATMVGGIPELINDGQTGLLVPPASTEGLAAALSRLARDRDLVRQLGDAARQKVLDEFDMASIGHEMRLLFETYGLVRDADVVAPGLAAFDEKRFLAGGVAAARTIAPDTPAPAPASGQSAAPTPGKRYALITPCRDEAEYARRTLDSIVNQTIRPTLWLIVDDGSTDETPAILAEYASRYDFIRVVRRTDRGKRSVGPGVVDAFYHGYDQLDPNDFDFVCKVDLDLDIPHGYFEELMRRMELYPRIGTCSGKPYFRGPDGQMISEKCGDEMSVGMIKFYRTDCFKQIGGFVREVMWDGIDCHRCRMLGWIAVSWDAPELRFEHLRPMGSSQKGIFTGRMRHGFGQYFMGTGLPYMTASAVFRMAHPPFVLGGLAMWWGFVRSMLARKPRYNDLAFRKFVRRYQWNCLVLGKFAATMRLNERQTGVWESLAAERVALSPRADTAARLAADLLESPVLAPAGPGVPVGLAPTALVDVPPLNRLTAPAGPQAAGPRRVEIGGIPIDDVTMDEAIARIESLIRAGTPSYVVTPNVDHIVKLQTQAPFRDAYQQASLVLPDGMPLLWAARFLGTPLKQKVSGSDLFPKFCDVAAREGYRLFFLGGRPGAAERSAELLRARHPGLQVETYCPSMGFESDDAENREIVRRIRDFRADVVFVGLGAPKQEQWIHRWHQEYAAPVSVGIGASFDFVAGYVRRAPVVMQRTGFEWAWRLMAEPRRMYRRYLIEDPKFLGIVVRQKRTPRPTPYVAPSQRPRSPHPAGAGVSATNAVGTGGAADGE